MAALDQHVLKQLRADIGDGTVADIFAEFVKDAEFQIARMQDSIGAGNVDGVRRAAHALKSTALLLGASDLARLCTALEEMAGAGAAPNVVKPKVAQAPRAYAVARRALEKEFSRS